jgi:hypothetical protein
MEIDDSRPVPNGNVAISTGGAADEAAETQTEPGLPTQCFAGETAQEITCHSCRSVSRRVEQLTDLPLPAPLASGDGALAPVDIGDLLKRLFEAEALTGDDKYHCDACGAKSDAEKRVVITKAPANMVLRLSRFAYDAKAGAAAKLCYYTSLPADISVPVGMRDWVRFSALLTFKVRSTSYSNLRVFVFHIARAEVTVARLLCDPLPIQLALRCCPRKDLGDLFALVFSTKCTKLFSQIFPRCGTLDRLCP